MAMTAQERNRRYRERKRDIGYIMDKENGKLPPLKQRGKYNHDRTTAKSK